MSKVKMVELELKMELKDDISAAIMTASIMPLTPAGNSSLTSFTKAKFVQPLLKMVNFPKKKYYYALGHSDLQERSHRVE